MESNSPKENDVSTKIFDLVYPVGSIYLSVNDVNPATIFGGVWERWGAGRVPVGVNPNESEFSSVEQTGGEKTHRITVDEIPNHNHGLIGVTCCWGTGNQNVAHIAQSVFMGTLGINELMFTSAGDKIYTDSNGGSQPQNLLQPYITCNMWKRIA